MKGTIELRKPIYINDQERKSFDYDTDEITVSMFAEADAKKKGRAGKSAHSSVSVAPELDFSLHLYLGMMAIIALDKSVDTSDLERIKGYDITRVLNVGRYFFIAPPEATSPPSDSGGQSATTAELSTPPEATSRDAD